MPNFHERLRFLRKEKGLTQAELATQLGISKSSVNMYERGEREPGLEMMESISDYFNVDMDYLYGRSTTKCRDPLSAPNLSPLPETEKLPLLGRIACGEPLLAIENVEDYVAVPSQFHADFVLECRGDSMIGAGIRDGDLVYIAQTPEVMDGEIAAVLIDDEATLKRVYYDREHSELALFAENPRFRTLRYVGESLNHIRILGRAVGLSRAI
jgi:repressor LexA